MQFKNYILASLLLLLSQSLIAQVGTLSGQVSESNGKEALIGANVYILGTTVGAATNGNGAYKLRKLKVGEYEIIVSYSGYKRLKQIVQIKEGKNNLDFHLLKSESELGEVVITGTGTPHHLKSTPVQTELINRRAIQEISGRTLDETLAGVSPSFDFNPGSMGAFMTLNGLSNKYILVLVDGKRLYGDIGGNIDLNRISPESIDRIEIVKGASSSLYGSEAMAGVINIITKKSKNKINIENNTRVGEYNDWQQRNSIDLNLGRFSTTSTFAHKESNGWQLSDYGLKKNKKTKQIDTVLTDAKAVNKFSDYEFKQEVKFAATSKLSLRALVSKYDKDVEYPLSVKKYGYKHDNLGYSFGAKYLLAKKSYLSLDYNSDRYKYYYNYNQDNISKSKSKELLNKKGEEVLQKEQERNDLNLKAVLDVNKYNKLTFGSEYVNEKYESDRLVNGTNVEAYTVSAFAQDEIKIAKDFIIYAGLRYTKHEQFGHSFSPKISALYKLKDINFRGAYAKGFKAPDLKELYYSYEKRHTLYLGNVNLKPQKNDYYSLSAEYIVKGMTLSISTYINDLTDMIAYREIETTPEDAANKVKTTKEHYNIGKARTQGVDIMFNVHLGAGFTVGGGYSYVDAKNEVEDIRLNGVAQNYATARLAWRHNWNNYSLNATLSGRIQDDKFYNDTHPNAQGYDLWKLTTTHHFADLGAFSLEATAGVDNIFDYVDKSPYGSHYGTLNPGRTVFIGCNIRFAR